MKSKGAIGKVMFILVLALFLSYGYWLNASFTDTVLGSLVAAVLFFMFYKIVSIFL